MTSIKGIKNTYRKTEIRTFKSQVCHETTQMHSQLQGQARPIFCKSYLNLTSEASESDVNLKSIQPKLARGSLKPIKHYVFFSTLHWLLSQMLMKCTGNRNDSNYITLCVFIKISYFGGNTQMFLTFLLKSLWSCW